MSFIRRHAAALKHAVAPPSASVAGDARMHALLRRLGRTVRASRVFLAEVTRKPGTGGDLSPSPVRMGRRRGRSDG
ncbi:hypothetical protein [Methanoculleus chikugoensis]|uniref:hypothetical protein n=1 Tax=Methanoculleus chikugoensis TaxID=118126 RepID=UPI001FB3A493|nr:hypothetical protein [Methanoculleus chikugoensis]